MKKPDYFYENYRMAKFYDDYYGRITGDIEFWVNAVKDKEDILEIACGTGRITFPILQSGKKVYALDYSQEMLDVLNDKNKDYKDKLKTYCQDMRYFNINKKFDVIIITSNSINHLEKTEDLEITLEKVAKHLKKDGILIFDILNPNFKYLVRNMNENYDHDTFVLKKTGETIKICENSLYNKASQINDVNYYYENEKGNITVLNIKVRLYYPQEMDYIISKSPFKIIEKYDWYDGRVFEGRTNEQIYILQKK